MAYTFYVCAAASLYALSLFGPRLRDSLFDLVVPLDGADPGSGGASRACPTRIRS